MDIQRFPLKLTLYKRGEMIYFSQIDIMHLLERALRRMRLPLIFTQGFNPHVKMSFGPALKLGREGKVELTLYFTQKICAHKVKEDLQTQLPPGLDILD